MRIIAPHYDEALSRYALRTGCVGSWRLTLEKMDWSILAGYCITSHVRWVYSLLYRQCYRWSEVYGKYLQSASPEELFRVLFKTLVYREACADFLAILQVSGYTNANAAEQCQKL